MKKFLCCIAMVFAALLSTVAEARLPKGFTVAETNHTDHIVFSKTAGGHVVVVMDAVQGDTNAYRQAIRDTMNSNSDMTCTKMKDNTPLGGPRFHCSDSSRQNFTLHLVQGDDMNSYAVIVITGDNYPGFGITYDDVIALMNYWAEVD